MKLFSSLAGDGPLINCWISGRHLRSPGSLLGPWRQPAANSRDLLSLPAQLLLLISAEAGRPTRPNSGFGRLLQPGPPQM